MLTKLNQQFTEWDGFDVWEKLTFGIATVCLAVPLIWGTWLYWAEILNQLPENASTLTTTLLLSVFALVYVAILGVLGWMWAYVSVAIGIVVSSVLSLFIWLYRKICP